MAQHILVRNGVNSPKEIVRPKQNFSPSLWGDQFMNFTLDTKLKEKYLKAIEVLKDEVKMMITASENEMVDTISLIETLERLGISYHFENEIEEKLNVFFNLNTNYEVEAYDLYTVSLHFRLFRQHGYRISSDIFTKFKDGDGKFKESLKSDARGLLSLYEAAHLRIHGENILEEALAFAKDNLKSMAQNLSLPLNKQVEHALYQPLHFGIPRLETHHHISVYEVGESKSESLLKFAKLDYNLVQMLHKQELCEVSRWWKELDMAFKIPYARDRIVECFFWAMGAFHEPRFTRGRVTFTKVIAFLSLTDDTYDAYATIEELATYTEAIQRWDIKEIDKLPEYMKPLYRNLLELYEQFGVELAKEGRSYALDYTLKAIKELVWSYYVEAKWIIEGYLPSFDEYLRNALTTSAYFLLANVALMGTEFSTEEEFKWLSKKPRMIVASMKICRLIGDIGSYKMEKGRGQLATGIDSYMMENGITVEETMDKILEMATDAWKDINECLLKPFSCSKDVRSIILNITRVIDVIYKNNEDAYSEPEKVIKPHIIAMCIDPFTI